MRASLAVILRFASVAVLGFAAAGCSGPSSVAPGSGGTQPFGATPLSLAFGTTQPIPQASHVALSGNGATSLASAFTVSVDDPTQVGATVTGNGVAPATIAIVPVSSGRTGATAVHVSNEIGAETIVSVSEGLCGRSDNLAPGSLLIYPRSGSRVSTHAGKLYFAVFSQKAAPTARLHLIVGSHGTLEGSRLMKAVAPRGATAVDARTGLVLTIMSATVPELLAATQYHAQIYDDACQPPLIVGTFRT